MSFHVTIMIIKKRLGVLVSNAGRVLLEERHQGLGLANALVGDAHCLTWTSNLRHDDIRSNDIIPKIGKKQNFTVVTVLSFLCAPLILATLK